MTWLTVHRRPSGDQNAIRFVADGFRWSVFLLPPAGLFARRLWLAGAAWIATAALLAGLNIAGLLSATAAAAALLVVNLMLALDAPEMERRQLARRGWPLVAAIDPRAPAAGMIPAETPARPAPMPALSGGSDVIGLFPDGHGR